jgi:hypothetical protein
LISLSFGDPSLPERRLLTFLDCGRVRVLRELRSVLPDSRSMAVRRRIARQIAYLDPAAQLEAVRWIEAVSEFDAQ